MKAPQFDEDYVRRLTDGDSAVECHFTAYFGQLLLIKLRSRGCSQRWIEDVRQETLARVFEILRTKGTLQNPNALGSFVASICDNVLLEYRRSEARLVPAEEAEKDDSAALEAELVNWDLRRQVEGVLAELSATDRAALKMVFLEEKDRAEVCWRLGITPSNLRVVLHRAKARFRERVAAKKNSLFGETFAGPGFTSISRGDSE